MKDNPDDAEADKPTAIICNWRLICRVAEGFIRMRYIYIRA